MFGVLSGFRGFRVEGLGDWPGFEGFGSSDDAGEPGLKILQGLGGSGIIGLEV